MTNMKYPIVFPLHPAGGKFRNNSELRYALRSIEKHFKSDYEVAIVSKKLPDWISGVSHVYGEGLKSSLIAAANAYPDGFFWVYDDFCLLRDITGEEMKVTPACRGWSKARTGWAKRLDSIRVRLTKENRPCFDYSRPHGPYWFDKSMVDEGFEDWPGMKSKFPWESWILSKRDWPRCHGAVKQYYGAYKGAPNSSVRYLNYNDKGNTPELRNFLHEKFPDPSIYEGPVIQEAISRSRVNGVVIDLASRPRWGVGCQKEMAEIGIDLTLFDGVDGHSGESPGIVVDRKNFRRFNRGRDPIAGEIGCYASHLKLARSALAGEIPSVSPDLPDWFLVFEDDAIPRGAVTGGRVLDWAKQADAQGMDYVWLHDGDKGRRNHGSSSVRPKSRKEIRTHAALISRRGLEIISSFHMCHPIDKAIDCSKRLRMGVLWGQCGFEQREWVPGVDAIAWERREGCINGMLSERTIVAGLHCGLGNQMFQIAAAAALAKKHGLPMEAAPCRAYRVPQGNPPNAYSDTIFRKITLVGDVGEGEALPEKSFHHQPVSLPRSYGRIIMGGWWQSAKHQEGLNVNDVFDLSWYDASPVRELRERFSKPLCAVHFRGGDFKKPSHKSRYICRGDYYRPILEKMRETYALVLVTDDPVTAQKELPSCDYLMADSDEKNALAFMTNCDAMVMGNSTFAWWAARLGNHREVHVPEIWFSPDDPRSKNDINMDHWITHPVDSPVRGPRSMDDLLCMAKGFKGVFHVGAHHGQEISSYLKFGAVNLALVEPDPGNFSILAKNAPATAALFQTALGDKEGKARFHVATNAGQSSSVLAPKKHLKCFPSVRFNRDIEVPICRMDQLPLDFSKFDLLVIDVQGAELMVMQGAGDLLDGFSHVITEFHEDEFYLGCARLNQIEDFLRERGFEKKSEVRRGGGEWGDALFSKNDARC